MDWLEVLLAAFGGGLAGASAGAWVTYRERLRGHRANLYAEHVIPFHDEVDTRRERSAERLEVTDTGGTPRNLRAMFRELDIAAATASGFDSRALRAIRAWLDQIDEAGRPYHERGDMPNEEANELAQNAVDQQGPLWTELNAYLWRYRRWVEWKLTKRPWSLPQRDRGIVHSGSAPRSAQTSALTARASDSTTSRRARRAAPRGCARNFPAQGFRNADGAASTRVAEA